LGGIAKASGLDEGLRVEDVLSSNCGREPAPAQAGDARDTIIGKGKPLAMRPGWEAAPALDFLDIAAGWGKTDSRRNDICGTGGFQDFQDEETIMSRAGKSISRRQFMRGSAGALAVPGAGAGQDALGLR